MGILKDSKPEETPPEPEEAASEDTGEDLNDRLQHFVDLGFDELTAWAFAWSDVSWSECRERFLKRGATHEQAARYYLT